MSLIFTFCLIASIIHTGIYFVRGVRPFEEHLRWAFLDYVYWWGGTLITWSFICWICVHIYCSSHQPVTPAETLPASTPSSSPSPSGPPYIVKGVLVHFDSGTSYCNLAIQKADGTSEDISGISNYESHFDGVMPSSEAVRNKTRYELSVQKYSDGTHRVLSCREI